MCAESWFIARAARYFLGLAALRNATMSATSCSDSANDSASGIRLDLSAVRALDVLAREARSRDCTHREPTPRSVGEDEADDCLALARDDSVSVETECDRGVRIDDGLDQRGSIEFLLNVGQVWTDVAAWRSESVARGTASGAERASPRCVSPA